MWRVGALVVAMAGPAVAEDWQALRGPEIVAALEMKAVRFDDGSEQLFLYGGLTRYRHGWPNEGHWRVKGDLYCSNWPPDEAWTCFDVAIRAADVRFSGPDHRAFVGQIVGEATGP